MCLHLMWMLETKIFENPSLLNRWRAINQEGQASIAKAGWGIRDFYEGDTFLNFNCSIDVHVPFTLSAAVITKNIPLRIKNLLWLILVPEKSFKCTKKSSLYILYSDKTSKFTMAHTEKKAITQKHKGTYVKE